MLTKLLFIVLFSILMSDLVLGFDKFKIVENLAEDIFKNNDAKTQLHRNRKWTDESRAMSNRYNLIQKSANVFEQEYGIEAKQAMDMARETIDRLINREEKRRFAGPLPPPIGDPNNWNTDISTCSAGQCKEAQKLLIHNTCNIPRINCPPQLPFRTINGICNNLKNPTWGAMSTKNRRFVPSNYADGHKEPRGGFTHNLRQKKNQECVDKGNVWLPNPRQISSTLHTSVDIEHPKFTHMLTQMGQFLDHDITLATEEEIEDCCKHPNKHDCFPINIPHNDTFVRINDCIEFTRSTPFCPDKSPVREQFNAITAFVDGSQIYGSDYKTMKSLRTFENGLLKVQYSNTKKEMLPLVDAEYKAGDIRAQDMPGLASLHTLFVREHNRIARLVKRKIPHLPDEPLFQEARRAVIAEWQHIVYEEWLPIILGQETVKEYGLVQGSNSFSTYNPNVNPQIMIDFSTAAFRFGHTLVQGLIKMMNIKTNEDILFYRLKDNFFNLAWYFSNSGRGMEEIINGFIDQPAQSYDRHVAEVLRNHLFESNFGMSSDLIARNIQRGRDHGMPGYISYREKCGMRRICDWKDRPEEIPAENWKILQSLYSTPADIELFPAGLSELPFQGGVVGRTFNCLIAQQFKDLKFGDRFFYTHGPHNGVMRPLSPIQVKQVRQRTLFQIICDNTDISKGRVDAFKLDSRMEECRKSEFYL